jgi:hypothetical protein
MKTSNFAALFFAASDDLNFTSKMPLAKEVISFKTFRLQEPSLLSKTAFGFEFRRLACFGTSQTKTDFTNWPTLGLPKGCPLTLLSISYRFRC